MYRTSDLVRQNDDGSRIYLGRRDTHSRYEATLEEIYGTDENGDYGFDDQEYVLS